MAWGAFLALPLALAGCAAGGPGDSASGGAANVALEVAPGVDLDTVDYEITGGDLEEPLTGELTLGGAADEPLVGLIAGIPEGTGYTIVLSATTEDGVSCQGSGEFDITDDMITSLSISILCENDPPRGTLDVNGVFNFCPALVSADASPSVQSVGEDVVVNVMADDEEGDDFAIEWNADVGEFGDSSAANTTYTCPEAGDLPLTVTATTDDGCEDSLTMVVTCVDGEPPPPPECGNGVVEEGEEC
ncbi:MAG: hypothetical protein ACOCXM_11195, partial [Myxococcota bacterium]